jgi:hypothetical protein
MQAATTTSITVTGNLIGRSAPYTQNVFEGCGDVCAHPHF